METSVEVKKYFALLENILPKIISYVFTSIYYDCNLLIVHNFSKEHLDIEMGHIQTMHSF